MTHEGINYNFSEHKKMWNNAKRPSHCYFFLKTTIPKKLQQYLNAVSSLKLVIAQTSTLFIALFTQNAEYCSLLAILFITTSVYIKDSVTQPINCTKPQQ